MSCHCSVPQFPHPWKEEGQSGLDRVLCELGRAGQEQGPFGFLLKLPVWASFRLPPWIQGHGDVKKTLSVFFTDGKT